MVLLLDRFPDKHCGSVLSDITGHHVCLYPGGCQGDVYHPPSISAGPQGTTIAFSDLQFFVRLRTSWLMSVFFLSSSMNLCWRIE
uniref:Uncharacterized protein n=1 Tax=Anguilla anguilla TaxID=7936 RepID=A0A0E9RKS8_ANGAN